MCNVLQQLLTLTKNDFRCGFQYHKVRKLNVNGELQRIRKELQYHLSTMIFGSVTHTSADGIQNNISLVHLNQMSHIWLKLYLIFTLGNAVA
jgi:hypothetical protein